ncbi:MAG: NAD(P)/FAD-dependent oxidoreductase [Alphaproteobacteria bacterium]|nr:NAD(P)/FAD-dependent oxidoreductase [Alphaproteobacteria bacterium]
MAHIVVLGAGIGGVPMAYEVRKTIGKADRVTVISDSPTFHFVPSNPWVAVGWRTAKQIKLDLAKMLGRKKIEVIVSAAKRVHPEENVVELENGNRVAYDHLIIATGPRLAFDEVPGLGPYDGHTQSICHVDHAEKARAAWDALIENPGPIVVGAVQGASCFGPAYEYAFILDTELRRRKIRDKVPMTFVTSEPWIGHLGLNGVGDSKAMMESAMRKRHINWVCNAKVERIDSGMVHALEINEDGSEKKRHEIPFAFSMMLPAFTGIDAVRDIEGLVNPRGFILLDKHQRNPKFANIWAVGVCIAIPPIGPTPVPTGVPKTGYMIESMVTATAKNIGDVVAGRAAEAEGTWSAVCLADMGDTGIAFVAVPQIPPRNVNWMSEGKWVHVAKVAFEKYFLRKLRRGVSEPFFEKQIMSMIGLKKLRGD